MYVTKTCCVLPLFKEHQDGDKKGMPQVPKLMCAPVLSLATPTLARKLVDEVETRHNLGITMGFSPAKHSGRLAKRTETRSKGIAS